MQVCFRALHVHVRCVEDDSTEYDATVHLEANGHIGIIAPVHADTASIRDQIAGHVMIAAAALAMEVH